MAKKKTGLTIEPSAVEETPVEKKPEPNIVFIGTGKAVTQINDGMTSMVLPEDQSKPFYHAEAARLCRLFPNKFKRFQRLGEV